MASLALSRQERSLHREVGLKQSVDETKLLRLSIVHDVAVVTIQRRGRRVRIDGIFGPIHADLKHSNGSTLQVVHTIDARIGVHNPTVGSAPPIGAIQ